VTHEDSPGEASPIAAPQTGAYTSQPASAAYLLVLVCRSIVSNVFTLKLLGGASLEGADGPLTGRVAQRRRLALLALLAMSRRPGLSREKLAATLWPESADDRARHLLSDTIYVINRALGGEVVAAVSDELRVQRDRLACDASAFEEAVEAGALEDALRRYTGPFLDGFFVEGSEEFERWVTAERDRLHGLYGRALERLAVERADRRDLRGAVECWRRLSTDDPLNSRVACQLADAMAAAGDRAGALQHLQDHTATLDRELGIEPPEEVTALLGSLRSARSESAPRAVSPPAEATSEPAPIASVAPVEAPSPRLNGSTPWRVRRSLVAIAVVAIVVLVSGLRVFWSRPTLTATSLRSVAVLPFVDLSAARNQEYFGDGMAEELSTQLARIPGLKVAARTSASAFKGTDTDVKAIGKALKVDAIVEGSVRQEEGRLRIAVRLVDARDGYQIWAETWDRSGRDVLEIQHEIASAVLRALRPADVAGLSPRPPVRVIDPVAYDLYLQGRYYWHQRSRDSLTRAVAAFERAVALAPNYAEAHSGVADAYAVLGFYDHLPPREAFPRAKVAATRALEIDDRLAEAYASLGYVALYYDWDWNAAERALTRATELNPSYSIGHQWLANYMVARGRFDEAVAAMRRAQETDPLSLIASAAMGWIHYYRRDYAGAVRQCRRTLDLNARFEQAWLWGGSAEEAAGHYREAVSMLQQAAELSHRSAIVLTALGRAHALSGDAATARAILAELRQNHADYLPAFDMAKLHVALGERAEALKWLQHAYQQRSHSIAFLAVDPQLDPLRSDPAFRELLVKTGVGH
jgi:TolB-like protein/DNA-binding SARP family transcriptional activator/Flp pilus assembly protein TadD